MINAKKAAEIAGSSRALQSKFLKEDLERQIPLAAKAGMTSYEVETTRCLLSEDVNYFESLGYTIDKTSEGYIISW